MHEGEESERRAKKQAGEKYEIREFPSELTGLTPKKVRLIGVPFDQLENSALDDDIEKLKTFLREAKRVGKSALPEVERRIQELKERHPEEEDQSLGSRKRVCVYTAKDGTWQVLTCYSGSNYNIEISSDET